jgi:hypothetical protein
MKIREHNRFEAHAAQTVGQGSCDDLAWQVNSMNALKIRTLYNIPISVFTRIRGDPELHHRK